MTPCPQTLAAVRVALAQPFADPVNVGGIPMRRAEARALERLLTTKKLPKRHPETRAEASGEVVPPSRTFSDSPSGRVGGAGGAKSSLPSLSGAFDRSFHDNEVANA